MKHVLFLTVVVLISVTGGFFSYSFFEKSLAKYTNDQKFSTDTPTDKVLERYAPEYYQSYTTEQKANFGYCLMTKKAAQDVVSTLDVESCLEASK